MVVLVGNGGNNCGVSLCARAYIYIYMYIHLCGRMDDFLRVWAR